MLSKLKQKFIIINMVLVGIVVLFIFVSLCVMTYRAEKEQTEKTLEAIVMMDKMNGKPEEKFHGAVPNIGGKEELPVTYAFSVAVDREGNITSSNGFGTGMEEEALALAVEYALSVDTEQGDIPDMGLMYIKRSTPFGYMIAFASTDRLANTVRTTAAIAGFACAVSLLIFYFISRFLANIAIKPIETAWQSQKQFVADASHDLKTPLTVILANMGILGAHKEELVESQSKWIESTKEEATRMRILVDKMLELAKSDDMRERLALCELDVSELTERTLLQFEPVAFEKGLTLEGKIESGIKIYTDEYSFVNLLHILVDNAIKYSEKGGKAEICLKKEKQYVHLSVKNEGQAIAEDDLPHIFERFYRADKARSVGGHGLGLSIAKNHAQNLGGKIFAQSDEQNGTVFTVILKG